jgi:hypothetical protein
VVMSDGWGLPVLKRFPRGTGSISPGPTGGERWPGARRWLGSLYNRVLELEFEILNAQLWTQIGKLTTLVSRGRSSHLGV